MSPSDNPIGGRRERVRVYELPRDRDALLANLPEIDAWANGIDHLIGACQCAELAVVVRGRDAIGWAWCMDGGDWIVCGPHEDAAPVAEASDLASVVEIIAPNPAVLGEANRERFAPDFRVFDLPEQLKDLEALGFERTKSRRSIELAPHASSVLVVFERGAPSAWAWRAGRGSWVLPGRGFEGKPLVVDDDTKTAARLLVTVSPVVPVADGITRAGSLATIAGQVLGIEKLEERGRDALDFHDLHVSAVRAALEAAYDAGARAAKGGAS